MYVNRAVLGLALGLLLSVIVAGAPACAAEPAAKEDLGELRIEGQNIALLRLLRRNGPATTFRQPAQILHLPAGEYTVDQVWLDGGYTLAKHRGKQHEFFEVQRDRPSMLKVGAPLLPTARVTRRGMCLEMADYDLVDAAGRSYTSRSRPPAPRFTVYHEGREIGSGTLKYG